MLKNLTHPFITYQPTHPHSHPIQKIQDSHVKNPTSPLEKKDPPRRLIIIQIPSERNGQVSYGRQDAQGQPDPEDSGVKPTGESLGTGGTGFFHTAEEEDPVEGFFLR